jgi:hypothetical protein
LGSGEGGKRRGEPHFVTRDLFFPTFLVRPVLSMQNRFLSSTQRTRPKVEDASRVLPAKTFREQRLSITAPPPPAPDQGRGGAVWDKRRPAKGRAVSGVTALPQCLELHHSRRRTYGGVTPWPAHLFCPCNSQRFSGLLLFCTLSRSQPQASAQSKPPDVSVLPEQFTSKLIHSEIAEGLIHETILFKNAEKTVILRSVWLTLGL